MPVRLVVAGAPPLKGGNQSERRRHFVRDYDWIRQALMLEPRGHDVMSGALLYPPTSDEFDMGLIYIETSGCLPMCGHGTIGSVTFALEQGHVTPRREGEVRIETPAGAVNARYQRDGDRVYSVTLTNVPSFLFARDVEIELPPLGRLVLDIAYGGNFYPIVEPQDNFDDCGDYPAAALLEMGRRLQQVVNQRIEVVHPGDPSIRGVNHCMWTGKPLHDGSHGRSVVVAGERLVDRSPCGTGTSARIAQRVARGWLDIGEPFVHESVIGSRFTGCATASTRVGDLPAIVPSITGSAWMTGFNTIFVDDGHPFPKGFMVN